MDSLFQHPLSDWAILNGKGAPSNTFAMNAAKLFFALVFFVFFFLLFLDFKIFCNKMMLSFPFAMSKQALNMHEYSLKTH